MYHCSKISAVTKVFTLHFADEASAMEVKVPNLKPFSPKKRIGAR